MTLIMWLIHTFNLHTKLGLIYPAYNLGFVSYIPKPEPKYTNSEFTAGNFITGLL